MSLLTVRIRAQRAKNSQLLLTRIKRLQPACVHLARTNNGLPSARLISEAQSFCTAPITLAGIGM